MAKTQHTTHIGIYGGSFNPIHTGHIALARTLLRLTSLDEIWFMVSPLNPFKRATEDLLADNLRLKLTQLALEGEPRLVASDFEFGLPKPSYTYDTLRKLTETYPQNHFTLIMGADNWIAFDRWKDHEKILRDYPIIVYPRHNSTVDAAALPPGVTLIDTPLYDFNSTVIRQRVADGRSIHGLVKPEIEELTREYYQNMAQHGDYDINMPKKNT